MYSPDDTTDFNAWCQQRSIADSIENYRWYLLEKKIASTNYENVNSVKPFESEQPIMDENLPIASRADLDRIELRTEIVEVPEWGTGLRVRIRELMGADRDAYEASIVGSRISGKRNAPRELNLLNARARLVARALIDANGQRLYQDAEAGKLGQKPAAGLEKIYNAVRRLSGISDEDEKELNEATADFTETNGFNGSVSV